MNEPSSKYSTVTLSPRWTSLKDTLIPPLENTPLTVALPTKWGLCVDAAPAIREVNIPASTILCIWICMVTSPWLKISAPRRAEFREQRRDKNPQSPSRRRAACPLDDARRVATYSQFQSIGDA